MDTNDDEGEKKKKLPTKFKYPDNPIIMKEEVN